MSELVYIDLGRAAYGPMLRVQRRLWQDVVSAGADLAYLVLLEHDPPVITLGRRPGEQHVLASSEELAARGIELHQTDRGGDVTYHGPGQLVGYPIIALDRRSRCVHRYFRDLEEVLIRLAARFGVEAGRIEGLTGVWVEDRKLAAMGITVRKWVAYHGFAINVCPDLSHFELIVPCGIRDRGVTSLQELTGRAVPLEEAKLATVECFADVFGFQRVRHGETEEDAAGRPTHSDNG